MLALFLTIENEKERIKVEKLYTDYGKLLLHIAKGILKSQEEAEDCLHDTFVKVITYLDDIEEQNIKKTRAFLVTIVRNMTINRYNKNKKHPVESIEEEEVENLPQLWCYDKPEIDDTLESYLLNISPLYRDVLTMKYVGEYSNSQIAKLLDISEATVRKRFERAKKQIIERGRTLYE